MTLEFRNSYPANPASVAAARAWTRAVLADALGGARSSAVTDDVALVVSELLTNSLLAGSSSLDVHVAVDEVFVRIALVDDAPGEPTPRAASSTEAHGRGLAIVVALAADWGVRRLGWRKEVWAQVAIP